MEIILLVLKFFSLVLGVKCIPAVISAVCGKMELDSFSQWIFAISTALFIFLQWIV